MLPRTTTRNHRAVRERDNHVEAEETSLREKSRIWRSWCWGEGHPRHRLVLEATTSSTTIHEAWPLEPPFLPS